MDIVTGLAVVSLMGAAATIAGAAEDLESDIGSMSNPNSQVQLAPQMGNLHRIFNKAVSGEPVAFGTWAGIAGSVALILLPTGFGPLFSIATGAFIAALVHAVFATTSHLGRTTGSSRFEQPLFLDVVTQHLGPIAAHGFIVTFCMVGLSYLMWTALGHPFPLPMLAVMWGITIGAVGSSTGDVHYGAEREYQQYPFGAGIPVAIHGDITRMAELGARNSIDVVNFCAKYGGPLTGFCFGLIVFLSFWTTIVFGATGGVIAGIVIILLLIYLNLRIEIFARENYGEYKQEKMEEL
ncbi:MAG: tetrahydromethanopterin S-methyltransferase subunit E [Euryarchaeota archaeon]|nr:tetrahydromethanopterin S-methyltransferase subunit E [Euryarchaeota archaeon]